MPYQWTYYRDGEYRHGDFSYPKVSRLFIYPSAWAMEGAGTRYVSCPVCSADPLSDCRTPTGRRRGYHCARYRNAAFDLIEAP
jgi:hypothetical protein